MKSVIIEKIKRPRVKKKMAKSINPINSNKDLIKKKILNEERN